MGDNYLKNGFYILTLAGALTLASSVFAPAFIYRNSENPKYSELYSKNSEKTNLKLSKLEKDKVSEPISPGNEDEARLFAYLLLGGFFATALGGAGVGILD